jgi:hypothetical protein
VRRDRHELTCARLDGRRGKLMAHVERHRRDWGGRRVRRDLDLDSVELAV